MQNGAEEGLIKHGFDHPPQSSPAHADNDSIANTNTSAHDQSLTSQPLDNDFSQNEPPSPAAKRRKLTGPEPPRQNRAFSPPWKKIHAEGPSTFHEGGIRKSARTNYVPMDLQPRSEKRQTRGAIQQGRPPTIKSKYGGVSTHNGEQLSPATRVNGTHANQRTGPLAPSLPRPAKKKSKSVTSSNSQLSADSSSTGVGSKRNHQINHRDTKSVPRDGITNLRSPRKVGRPRRSSTAQTPQLPYSSSSLGPPSATKEIVNEIPSALSHSSPHKPQRLNLRFNMLPIGVFSIGNIARKQEVQDGNVSRPAFSSFQEWVENEGRFEAEEKDKKIKKIDLRLDDLAVQREAAIRHEISLAGKPGGVLSRARCSYYHKEEKETIPRLYTHQDRLLAHMSRFSWLMTQEKRRHLRAAKECAYHAAAVARERHEAEYREWKSKQPKSAEEMAEEEHEMFKTFYIQLLQDVKSKWQMVTSEVEELRLQRWQAEQDRIGKEALNDAIEKSRGLLSRRKRRHATGSDEDGSSSSEDSRASASSESESDDDSNMSSSGSESDISQSLVDNDAALTQDQLRTKYSRRESEKIAAPSGTVDIAQEEAQSPPHVHDHLHDEGLLEQDDRLLALPQSASNDKPTLEEVDPALMDDSDQSTDMDDESESDTDSASDALRDSSEGSEAEDGFGLLGGFLTKAEKDHLQHVSVENSEPQKEPSIDFETSDDEADKVSLIPDITQAPTPSASNSEEPPWHLKDPIGTVANAQIDGKARASEPTNLSHSMLPETDDEIPNLTSQHTNQALREDCHQEDALPVSPISIQNLKVPVPSLLRGTLREYQHYGLDWLAGLYSNGTNGILADEMGLGKTIQTISLLAHLAENHEVWGPHLIVVPTSVMLNWEMEFKKFLPGFKVLTYYGTQEERRRKRAGWTDNDKWNVWITSYTLITQDQQVFKRKAWHYMILDEAHNIKNFQSLRWQTLLTFRTRARLLLTGTPLQNNLTELWSLLYFLMPSDDSGTGIAGFTDLEAFTGWFKRPTEQILEQGKLDLDAEARTAVRKLHDILRPYLLRRLKADVEKQMPGKYEHVVNCRLSKRQRYLYDGFMSRAQTREVLASGNTFSVMNALMQLRKVCNHPDLFETRQIVTSFAMPKSAIADFEIKELLVRRKIFKEPMSKVDLNLVNLLPGENEVMSALDTVQKQRLGALGVIRQLTGQQGGRVNWAQSFDGSSVDSALAHFENNARRLRYDKLHQTSYLTSLRSQRRPLFSYELMDRLRFGIKALPHQPPPARRTRLSAWHTNWSPALHGMVQSISDRSYAMEAIIQKFTCTTPNAVATDMVDFAYGAKGVQQCQEVINLSAEDPFHEARIRQCIAFPDKRLLQYDCGKLQELDKLLRRLQTGGHRALIFTQMTRVLDILEQFMSIHGHRYLRLDGATKPEQRQMLTERFNNDNRILVFILSSRSGGIGVNLTGADTVIFYDLDWNPAMDKQCQDRCHRIGQTRDVHIYRLVSENTIEANILRKANQKRMLDDVVIQEGDFTTDYFNNMSVKDIVGDSLQFDDTDDITKAAMDRVLGGSAKGRVLEAVEDQDDAKAAKEAEKEIVATDAQDFSEDKNLESTSASVPKADSTFEGISNLSRPTKGDGIEVTTTMEAADSGLLIPQEPLEEQPGPSCDDYMIRFRDWELRDIAVQPPTDKKKKKKKGKESLARKK